jgi:hypothetical protein
MGFRDVGDGKEMAAKLQTARNLYMQFVIFTNDSSLRRGTYLLERGKEELSWPQAAKISRPLLFRMKV